MERESYGNPCHQHNLMLYIATFCDLNFSLILGDCTVHKIETLCRTNMTQWEFY